eukprot:gene18829-22496_t
MLGAAVRFTHVTVGASEVVGLVVVVVGLRVVGVEEGNWVVTVGALVGALVVGELVGVPVGEPVDGVAVGDLVVGSVVGVKVMVGMAVVGWPVSVGARVMVGVVGAENTAYHAISLISFNLRETLATGQMAEWLDI